MPRRQLDDEVGIIGLDLCLVCSLITYDGTTPLTPVSDYIAAPCVRLCLDRSQYSTTGVSSISRIYVHVDGAEAEGTMVSRRVAKRENLLAAVLADKATIVF